MLELIAAAVAAASCAIPADLAPAPVLPAEARRRLPVTALVLAYYWWPQQCRRDDQVGAPGCAAGFGFKVHGLWPDAANGTWPQFCKTPTPIDLPTVRAAYCMTPSPALMQHEWAKHGSCGWPSAAAYFARARQLADSIRLPELDGRSAGLTAGSLRDAVVAANPRLPRAGLFVATDRDQWLTELRVCLTRNYAPTPCADGNIGAGDGVPLRVWPRRASR